MKSHEYALQDRDCNWNDVVTKGPRHFDYMDYPHLDGRGLHSHINSESAEKRLCQNYNCQTTRDGTAT